MTEKKAEPRTAIIAGRIVGILMPTDGQWEALVRIQKTLQRSTDDDTTEFYAKQVDRIGTLLENLIEEKDRDLVDQLFLTGKISSAELMLAIFNAIKGETAEQLGASGVKKAAGVRTQRK